MGGMTIERIRSSNEFWALGSGDHLNMIDTLLECIEELECADERGMIKRLKQAGYAVVKLSETQKKDIETCNTVSECLGCSCSICIADY